MTAGLLSALLMLGIWLLNASSALPAPPLGWLLQGLEYTLLGALLARASGSRGRGLVLAVWLCALDQLHQAFVPGHDAGIQNWLLGLLGAWVGGRWLGGRLARTRAAPDAASSDSLNPT